MDKVFFASEDGKNIELFILEETTISESHYILAAEDESEDSTAYILKEVSRNGEDIVFSMVEDDNEFDAVLSVFEELMDDTDFE
jgi:hypothetical protein